MLEPPNFIGRLAALVPKPVVNLTRYHGVLVPDGPQPGEITLGKRGDRAGTSPTDEPKSDAERRVAMGWAYPLGVHTAQSMTAARSKLAFVARE